MSLSAVRQGVAALWKVIWAFIKDALALVVRVWRESAAALASALVQPGTRVAGAGVALAVGLTVLERIETNLSAMFRPGGASGRFGDIAAWDAQRERELRCSRPGATGRSSSRPSRPTWPCSRKTWCPSTRWWTRSW